MREKKTHYCGFYHYFLEVSDQSFLTTLLGRKGGRRDGSNNTLPQTKVGLKTLNFAYVL